LERRNRDLENSLQENEELANTSKKRKVSYQNDSNVNQNRTENNRNESTAEIHRTGDHSIKNHQYSESLIQESINSVHYNAPSQHFSTPTTQHDQFIFKEDN